MKIDISKYRNVKEFENIDEIYLTDKKLDGRKVWEEFKKLNKIENFTQKEFKKSKLNSLMQFFTFSILKFNESHTLPHYSEEYGGYYLVQDYENYIVDDKFDRAKYLAKKDEIFL